MVKPRTDFDHRARKLLFSNVLFYRLLLSKTGVASKRLYVISLYFSVFLCQVCSFSGVLCLKTEDDGQGKCLEVETRILLQLYFYCFYK